MEQKVAIFDVNNEAGMDLTNELTKKVLTSDIGT